jgi:hypothetical protein
MADFEPRSTGRVSEMSISGYLMPAHGNRQPVLIGMAGTDDFFIVVFSTAEKLRSFMEAIGIGFDRIQKVTNGVEFIESIDEENARGNRPYALRIAADPYKHENGNWRFTEIFGMGD